MTEGRACASCGAQNAPEARFCWQCYARFGGAGVPAAAAAVPAAVGTPGGAPHAAAGGAVGAPAAPPLPPWQSTSRYASQSSLPEPIPESRWPVRRIVNILMLVAVAIGGVVAWRTFTGSPFPSSIRGFERLDTKEAELFEDTVKETGERLGVKMRGALYGRGGEVSFMALLSERTDSVMGLDAAFLEPLPVDPVLASGAQQFERDGASYQCFGIAAELSGSGCLWLEAEQVGFVFVQGMGVPEGFELAAAVRDAVA